MELPDDITTIITHYAWAWRAPTRTNWREGSSIISLVKSDPLWQQWKDYQQWKQQNELKCITHLKPRTSINDVLLGVSVAVCADIFVQLVIPYLRRKLK